MKKLFSILVSLFIAGIVFSQTQSTVTINTTGNRNKQLVVDNKTYTITNTNATAEQTITITDLAAGQHSLDVIRTNQYNNRISTRTYFTVREGYDLTISIASNGSVSTAETRINNAIAGKPISKAAFNKLYSQTKAKTSSVARTAFLEKEFATNKRFTASQASQLIQLVNSESMRLKLAKKSYPGITDRENFNLVSNLLNSSANRTELDNYVASLDLDDIDYAASDIGAPITAEKFTTIYNEVHAEISSYERDYYLRNFFAKDYNFYTSTQAAQLIRLVPGEEERFNLAKAAYRGITDRQNYNMVNQLLSNASNRVALTAYTTAYDNSNSNVRTAMSTTDFDRLYNSVYYQSSSSRYSSIYNSFTSGGNYFTVAQAKKIIPLVSSENSRLALAKAAYPVLVDRSNYAEFNEFLAYSSSETDLYNYVVNYNNSQSGGGYGMTETQYNTIYQNVANSWSQSARLSVTTEAFNNSNNYFTVDQVRQLILLISAENDRLSLAKNAYANTIDKANFSRLYDLFSYTANRNDLINFVAANGGTGVGVIVAMSESQFNSLYQNVANSWGQSTKISLETEAFNNTNNYFTVDQVRQLLLLITTENDRLSLAKNAYNNTVDQVNFNRLYDVFSSTANRNDLATFIANNGGTATVTVVAMSESEYNSMYRSVQMTFGFGAKMSALTDIFNKATNYFTVEQARQLIRLVSDEDNRLALAKSSYNNIVDRENFENIYDIFSSQSSKDELKNFVSSNAYNN